MLEAKDVQVGQTYDVDLKGARGQYALRATVVGVVDGRATLQTNDGRLLEVPLDAVVAARATELDVSTSQRTQGDLARQLARDLEAAELGGPSERLHTLRESLNGIAESITSRVNRGRLESLLIVIGELESYVQATNPADAVVQRKALASVLRAAKVHRPRGRPNALPAQLDRVLSMLVTIEQEYSAAYWGRKVSPPRILTSDRVNVTRGQDSEFDLPVRISLDQGAPDVEEVTLVLDKYRNLKLIGAAPKVQTLRAGQSITLTARMRDNRKQGARGDVRVEAHVTYVALSGDVRQSPRQTLDLRIVGRESHIEIPNPFRAYAGGLPVENPDMFFGREDLVNQFCKDLVKSSGGTCFALYGQQRTGKSSVLQQVTARLRRDGAVVASLSMGMIDRHSMTVDFAEEVLDQFRVQVDGLLPAELARGLFNRWPDAAAIERRPLRSFQRAREAARTLLRSAGLAGVPFIVVVDEFTYLHEILRRRGIDPAEHNELRDFMRQLKALLEAKLFSALLVGQDTMPRFLDSYPNEFSVMTTRKLDYLTQEDTQALADDPIKLPGGNSRYSGYALATIATYTDGHPFFTQILCDRVITLVNERNRPDITQSDVEEAIESLISGQRRIESHKFDCLVTADNSHALISQMADGEDSGQASSGDSEPRGSSDAQLVLSRIAAMSGSQNHPVPVDDLQLEVSQRAALDDLLLRGVVRETEAGVAIRVLLYADYLRRRIA